jgi:hypothetical protein
MIIGSARSDASKPGSPCPSLVEVATTGKASAASPRWTEPTLGG